MAEPALILVGEALLELLVEGLARVRPHAHSLLVHLRRAAEPPPGVTFRSQDGASFTGVALLDHNKVTALLASRTEPLLSPTSERQERPPLITPPPSPQRPYYGSQRTLYEREPEEDEEPDWGESSGYGRYK